MIKDVEALYAEHYSRFNSNYSSSTLNSSQLLADNDKKRARERLRGAIRHDTQHSRTFRSGVYVGLGIPALVHAIYLSECLSLATVTVH